MALPWNALAYLDQCIDMQDENLMIQSIENVSFSEKGVKDICRILMANENGESRWRQIFPILKDIKGDPDAIRRGIANYLGAVLVNGNSKVVPLMPYFMDSIVHSGKGGLAFLCYSACMEE